MNMTSKKGVCVSENTIQDILLTLKRGTSFISSQKGILYFVCCCFFFYDTCTDYNKLSQVKPLIMTQTVVFTSLEKRFV